jgi:hypothetical protein
MKSGWKTFISPFDKVAGVKSLLWGVAGLAVSIVVSIFSGLHAHGLLNFGYAPVGDWWVHAVEYLVIWLVPAAIIWGLGAALSRSRVRAVDVFGTVAFSLLPLVAMNLFWLVPPMGEMLKHSASPSDLIAWMQSLVVTPLTPSLNVLLAVTSLVSCVAVVLMLVWLFKVVKVVCNLSGWRLWSVYLVGIVGGDIVCRILIKLLY